MKRFEPRQQVVVYYHQTLRTGKYLNISTVKQERFHEVEVAGNVGDEFLEDSKVFRNLEEARRRYPHARLHPSLNPNHKKDPWAQF